MKFMKLMKAIMASLLFLIMPFMVPAISLMAANIELEADEKLLEDQDLDHIQEVIKLVETAEQKEFNLIASEVLYDIDENPSYVLLKSNNAYIIYVRGTSVISEYSLDYIPTGYNTEEKNEKTHYFGPFNDESTKTSSIELEAIKESYREFADLNQKFLDDARAPATKESRGEYRNNYDGQWEGCWYDQCKNYSSGLWVNSVSNYPYEFSLCPNGICGTVASAAMLAYHDDYVDNSYVPASIRVYRESGPGQLIKKLFNYIDYGNNKGTVASDLVYGINRFFAMNSVPHSANYTIGRPWSFAVQQLNKEKVVVVGTSSISTIPSDYRNHWVMAYQYNQGNTSSNDWFKCVDNHGSASTAINAGWTIAGVAVN